MAKKKEKLPDRLEGEDDEAYAARCAELSGKKPTEGAYKLYEVPRRVEEEQAAALHWMLNLYLAHGQEWRSVGEKILKAEAPQNIRS